MPVITFIPENIRSTVPAGSTISEAARLAGVEINTPCGGQGACGKCLVRIVSGDVDFGYHGKPKRELVDKGYVLACKAKCGSGDVVVEIPEKSIIGGRFCDTVDFTQMIEPGLMPSPRDISPLAVSTQLKVPMPGDNKFSGLPDFDRFVVEVNKKNKTDEIYCPIDIVQCLADTLRRENGAVGTVFRIEDRKCSIIDISAGTVSDRSYGIAVDIGTTTVAVALVELPSAKIIDVQTDYNGQIACGLDVISRINYAGRNNGLEELTQKVLITINDLIARTIKNTGISNRDIVCSAFSGNTTMTHLFLGLPPENIRIAPFIPTVLDVPLYTAEDIGLEINIHAPALLSPAIGSYVGGDITAGVLCSGLVTDSKDLCLYMDIGTNGELVLGNDEFLLACACSAGPAFEGGGIGMGMRACEGAIERVEIDPESGMANVFTIGNTLPAGICGSGMISLISGLFRTGWLDPLGKIDRSRVCESIVEDGRRAKYVLAQAQKSLNGKSLIITESEIENIIRAKAAVYSACALMLKQAGAGFGDVKKIYIAGGFGRYLNIEDCVTIGLLPDINRDKFVFLGNASLAGTYMVLVSDGHRHLQKETARRMTYLELTTDPEYMEQYTAAMFLPHTDSKLFPGVKRPNI